MVNFNGNGEITALDALEIIHALQSAVQAIPQLAPLPMSSLPKSSSPSAPLCADPTVAKRPEIASEPVGLFLPLSRREHSGVRPPQRPQGCGSFDFSGFFREIPARDSSDEQW